MKDYFKLLFLITNRKIKDTGLHPIIGYLLGLIAFFIISEQIFTHTNFAKYMVILTCISLQFKLSEKNRSDFLLSTFGDQSKIKIRLIENFILCLPFVSILLYKSFLFESSILFLCSLVLALFSYQSNFNLTIPTPFSKRPFEFSTGFRKTFFIFFIAYLLTIIAIRVNNLNLGIFAFLLIFLTSMSYYQKPEEKYYVWIHAQKPNIFLKNKIFNAFKNASLTIAPILITLIIFYPTDIELILFFFIMGLLFLCSAILAKYSVYPDQINIPEGILIAFCLYFPPLLLAIIPFFYSKSSTKLKFLLND